MTGSFPLLALREKYTSLPPHHWQNYEKNSGQRIVGRLLQVTSGQCLMERLSNIPLPPATVTKCIPRVLVRPKCESGKHTAQPPYPIIIIKRTRDQSHQQTLLSLLSPFDLGTVCYCGVTQTMLIDAASQVDENPLHGAKLSAAHVSPIKHLPYSSWRARKAIL